MTDLSEPATGFVTPARLGAPPRLAERHPALFPLAVWVHRARRRVALIRSGTPWSTARSAVPLQARVKRHRNDTSLTFQILVAVGDRHLEGDLRADRPLDRAYRSTPVTRRS